MRAWMLLLAAFHLVSVCLVPMVEAGTYQQARELLLKFRTNYNKHLRPVRDQSQVLKISFQLILVAVTNLDTVGGTMTTNVVLDLTWNDENLYWKSADYGNINSVSIQQDEIWLPPLLVSNGKNILKLYSVYVKARPWDIGWTPGGEVTSLCDFNMKYWPFDKQICEIKFVALSYEQDEIDFIVRGLDKTFYSGDGEWALEGTHFYNSTIYKQSQAVFVLKFRRLPTFYILTIILPLLMVASLNGFVFMLSSSSGERVGFSITIMLSVTVFLTIISTELPRTANPTPIIAIYVIIVMTICSFTIVCVILNLLIHNRKKEVPIASLFLIIYKTTQFVERMGKCTLKGSASVGPPEEIECSHNLQGNVNDDRGGSSTKHEQITWKAVSSAIDKMLFVLINITIISASTILFFQLLLSDYPDKTN